MKKNWKRIIAAGCIAALLMTGPGVTVLGAELQEPVPSSEVISEEPLDEVREDIEAEAQSEITDASAEDAALKNDGVEIPGAGQVEIEGTNVSEEEIGSGEETNLQEAETPDEVENVPVEEDAETETDDLLEDNSSQEDEESVGLSYTLVDELPVGDNVYATIIRDYYLNGQESGEVTWLTLQCYKYGTLYSDWQDRITKEIPNENWKESLTSINVLSNAGKLIFPEISAGLFMGFPNVQSISFNGIDTSKAQTMNSMFYGCESLTSLDLSGFDVSQVIGMAGMFYNCKSLKKLNLSNFNSPVIWWVNNMFEGCTSLEELDISSLSLLYIHMEGEYMEIPAGAQDMFKNCSKLKTLKTPPKATSGILLPKTMYDSNGTIYKELPNTGKSIVLSSTEKININYATIKGINISYGYTGQPHTPAFTVTYDGRTLVAGKDYTFSFSRNVNPGTARLAVFGKGTFTGTANHLFTIVDCVANPKVGKTYMLVPKNNPEGAICTKGGKMVNNTIAGITDQSSSESVKFVLKQSTDGYYKLMSSKCELVIAVQQNSKELGKKVVIYQDTKKPAQNWKIERKADNSYAIVNAVTGYSITTPTSLANKGTELVMAKTAASSLQRFYFVETSAVNPTHDGTYSFRAARNKNYAVEIAGGSTADGANVQLYKYNGTDAQKFTAMYSGGGYYRLVNKKSGMVLTVEGNSKTNGANVIQSTWAGLSGQRWKFFKNNDGTIVLTSALGTVLHLHTNTIKNGMNITSRDPLDTTAQRWFRINA